MRWNVGPPYPNMQDAFKTVERFDLESDSWATLPSMIVGRHTSAAAILASGKGSDRVLVAAAGVGQMGGSPLLTDTEQLDYGSAPPPPAPRRKEASR